MTEIIAGLVALAVPALLIGSIVLWRTKPVLLMYYALVLVGLGYLTTTGAVEDVGRQALAYMESREGAPVPQAAAPAPLSPAAPKEAQVPQAPAPQADAAAAQPAPVPAPADAAPAQPAPQP